MAKKKRAVKKSGTKKPARGKRKVKRKVARAKRGSSQASGTKAAAVRKYAPAHPDAGAAEIAKAVGYNKRGPVDTMLSRERGMARQYKKQNPSATHADIATALGWDERYISLLLSTGKQGSKGQQSEGRGEQLETPGFARVAVLEGLSALASECGGVGEVRRHLDLLEKLV